MHIGIEGFFITFIGLALVSLLPGVLTTGILFPGNRMDWLERVPVGFAISLGLLLIPIVAVRWFAWGWREFLWIWGAIEIAILITVFVVWRSKVQSPQRAELLDPPQQTRRILLALFLIVLIAAGLLTLFTGRDEDDWNYLSDIRRIVDTTQFTPLVFRDLRDRNVIHAWWFLHALIVGQFGVDPVRLVQDWMPILFAPMSLLSFYALARALFPTNWAIGAALVQFFFLLLDLFNPDESIPWPGWWVFARIDQDHTFVIFVLLPVFAALVFRFVQQGNLRCLAAAVLVQFAMVASHASMGLILSALAVLPFLVVHLFFVQQPEERERVAWLGAAVALVALLESTAIVYFFQRFFIGVGARLLTPEDIVFPLNRYHYTFFSPAAFTLRVDFLGQPPALAAILLTPFLISFLKQSLAARYLFASMLGLLLVLYVPGVFMQLELHMGGTIMRLWNWLPKALVIVFFLPHLIQLLRQGFFAMRRRDWNRHAVGAALVVFASLCLLAIAPAYVRDDLAPPLQLGQGLPEGSHELLYALREHSAPGDVVLAWRDITDAVQGYRHTLNPVLFRENPRSSRRQDADRFYSVGVLTSTHFEILRKYNVAFVILAGNRELVSQFDYWSEGIVPVYRNKYGVIYRISAPLESGELIEANDALAHGEWATAVDKYNRFLSAHPENTLARTGLGIVLELSSQPRKAVSEFEAAVQGEPNNMQAHMHLVRLYRLLGMDDQAAAHIEPAGRMIENLQ